MKIRSCLAFAVALAVAPACVFVVDDTGVRTRSAWEHDGGGAHVRLRGSGTPASEIRAVDEFHAIALNGAIDARVRIGTPASVLVTCDDNLLEHVRTEVDNGVLRVGLASGSYTTREPMRVAIVAPTLDAVALNGSGDVSVDTVDAERFGVAISGSGTIAAQGRATQLDVSVSGSGDVGCFGLSAQRVKVSIAGSGDVSVSASESLEASISGSGDVRYRGSPRVTRSVAGSGSVERD